MKINLTSVMVNDQAKALKFYTEVLRFVKKAEFPVGAYRWITVVSPEGPADVELALEPNAHPVTRAFQEGWYRERLPFTAFAVDDIQAEHARLKKLGVQFIKEPTKMGPVTIAIFDDTVGNYIQIYQG